eukprot:PhM_4_TR4889/c0_g1_i1/m.27626
MSAPNNNNTNNNNEHHHQHQPQPYFVSENYNNYQQQHQQQQHQLSQHAVAFQQQLQPLDLANPTTTAYPTVYTMMPQQQQQSTSSLVYVFQVDDGVSPFYHSQGSPFTTSTPLYQTTAATMTDGSNNTVMGREMAAGSPLVTLVPVMGSAQNLLQSVQPTPPTPLFYPNKQPPRRDSSGSSETSPLNAVPAAALHPPPSRSSESRKQLPYQRLVQDHARRNAGNRCYHCGREGHQRRDCPEILHPPAHSSALMRSQREAEQQRQQQQSAEQKQQQQYK